MEEKLNLEIFKLLEEQQLVCFSGNINILNRSTAASIGTILFYEGKVINAKMGKMPAYKSFIQLCIKVISSENYSFVVEPEIINEKEEKISFPLNMLKEKTLKAYNEFIKADKNKPPESVQLLPREDFFESEEKVTPEEFKLLCTISDYSRVRDIYENSTLLDYEVTNALVSLRKKQAIKVVKSK